jgi:hypothetical protein
MEGFPYQAPRLHVYFDPSPGQVVGHLQIKVNGKPLQVGKEVLRVQGFEVGKDAVRPTVLHQLQQWIQAIQLGSRGKEDKERHTWRTVPHGPESATPVPLSEVPKKHRAPGGPWGRRKSTGGFYTLDSSVGREEGIEPMVLRLDPHGHLRDELVDRGNNPTGDLSADYQQNLGLGTQWTMIVTDRELLRRGIQGVMAN